MVTPLPPGPTTTATTVGHPPPLDDYSGFCVAERRHTPHTPTYYPALPPFGAGLRWNDIFCGCNYDRTYAAFGSSTFPHHHCSPLTRHTIPVNTPRVLTHTGSCYRIGYILDYRDIRCGGLPAVVGSRTTPACYSLYYCASPSTITGSSTTTFTMDIGCHRLRGFGL